MQKVKERVGVDEFRKEINWSNFRSSRLPKIIQRLWGQIKVRKFTALPGDVKKATLKVDQFTKWVEQLLPHNVEETPTNSGLISSEIEEAYKKLRDDNVWRLTRPELILVALYSQGPKSGALKYILVKRTMGWQMISSQTVENYYWPLDLKVQTGLYEGRVHRQKGQTEFILQRKVDDSEAIVKVELNIPIKGKPWHYCGEYNGLLLLPILPVTKPRIRSVFITHFSGMNYRGWVI